MQQRTYRGGNGTPESLADFLVQHFSQDSKLRAQKVGEGNSLLVQVGRRDHQDRPVLTIAIHRPTDQDSDVVVTVGSQSWIDENMIGYAALMGLIAILVTPFALFALIWPLSRLWNTEELANEVNTLIDTFMVGQGAAPLGVSEVEHPHVRQA